MLKTTEPPINLSAKEFIDILQGKYLDLDSVYVRFYIKSYSHEVSIEIANVLLTETINANSVLESPFEIRIENSVFAGKITFGNDVVAKSISFSRCFFNEKIVFSGVRIKSLRFSDSVLEKGIKILSSVVEEQVSFSGGYCM